MLNTPSSRRGMVVAPHHLAAQAGLSVLREGGNAVEAMVAAAATIAVVYPHMNGIGGDGFWLIAEPGEAPRRDRRLRSGGIRPPHRTSTATMGMSAIPSRGPLAANTVAGTVSGWGAALDVARGLERPEAAAVAPAGGRRPLCPRRRTGDRQPVALHGGEAGRAGTHPRLRPDLSAGGTAPAPGSLFRQPDLASTLERIGTAGIDDFYRGELARALAEGSDAGRQPRGARRPGGATMPNWSNR